MKIDEKKVQKMSRKDWGQMAACAKDMYLKSMDLHLLCSARFGKAHHAAKKADRVCKLMSQLKSELDDLAYEYAQDLFNEKEIGRLFYGN